MGAWTWPAVAGVLLGTAVFLLILVPVLAYQYRQYGRFTARRVLGVAAVSVYGAAVVAYTLLPLPDSRANWCPAPGLSPQWRPFSFVSDIAEASTGSGALGMLSSRVTLQVVFNVLLFVPWGVILRGFAGKSMLLAVVSGLAASLAVEATQATGVWGFYECPYRLGDVDDLIMNTLGAFLGAALAPLMLWWMPRPHTFRASQQLPRPVTNVRRWVGMAVDLFAFHAFGYALVVMYRLLLPAEVDLPGEPTLIEAILLTLVPALVVFFLPAWRGTGASIGQHTMRLIPVWTGDASWVRRTARAASVGGTYALLLFCSHLPGAAAWTEGAGVFAWGLLIAAFIAVPLTGQRGLSGVLTGARMLDERLANIPALQTKAPE